MPSRVLVSDQARKLVEVEQERRIREKWKRGCSIEQIASEAIVWYVRYGPINQFKDKNYENSIVREEGF